MTRTHTTLALVTAVAALALVPGSATAATTCAHTTPGLLEVNMSAHKDSVYLQTSAQFINILTTSGAATCAGTAPTHNNVDTVLIVDDSDNPATPAVGDGDTGIAIANPAYFGPGKTAETTGTSEIEFLVDTRGGTDQLSVGGNDKQTLVVGDAGAAWNHDGDAEMAGLPFDEIQLYGAGGQDYLSAQGGSGTGSALTNARAVEISGAEGNDVLLGSDIAGGDRLLPHYGADSVNGYGGDDVVTPNEGDDTVQGGAGADTVNFAMAPVGVTVDLATAGAQDTGEGRDTLTGFENVNGSDQADRLFGDAAANVLRGDGGDDVIEGRGGADELHGEEGSDTVSYAGSPAGVNVDLARITQPTDADKFFGIENVSGSPFADTLAGNGSANRIAARDGVGDRITCGGGADSAITDRRSLDSVDADCDSIDALPEPFRPVAATPTSASPAGTPSRRAVPKCGGKRATIVGTAKSDVLRGTRRADVIVALGGNDRISAARGNDVVCAGAGNDRVLGQSGRDRCDGGSGRDRLDCERKRRA